MRCLNLIFIVCCCFFEVHALKCKSHKIPDLESVKSYLVRHLESFDGWCSDSKALILAELVLEHKPKVCVEIGVFDGASLFPVCLACKVNGGGTVYAVDPWDAKEASKGYTGSSKIWWDSLNLERTYKSFLQKFRYHDLLDVTHIIRKTSSQAIDDIPSEIDFLHVDGNHSFAQVYFDVTHYVPKVRCGGIIVCSRLKWEENIRDQHGNLLETKYPVSEAFSEVSHLCEVINCCDQWDTVFFRKKF